MLARTGRILGSFILALFVLAASFALRVPLAAAQTADGLEVAASTMFVPNPANENIQVRANYVLTNRQADEVVGDSVRSFFYTRWVIAMPANVTDVVATSNNQQLEVLLEFDPMTTEPDPAQTAPGASDAALAGDDEAIEPNVVFGSIRLPTDLTFGQSVTIDVSYTIPGGEPRAVGPVARVNTSFLSFSVWTPGDPGLTDVRIQIPDGFSMDIQGDLESLESVERDGVSYLEAVGIEAPRDFFGQVFGRNDSGLITDFAELPGAEAIVRAWPDDPDWAEFVVQAIEQDVPVIEDLTGMDWPAGDIEVIETVTPYLYGYGGWFNASSGRIEIGENLERDLILHELAHAWFNEKLIEGRWITEGLAEEFASRAIAATPTTALPPVDQLDPNQPVLDDPLRVQLSQWASPWTLDEEDAFAYEQFHYNASWWVIRQLTNDVGLEAFSDVLIALRNDEIAYLGEGPVEQTQTPTRWTHLFDLLERRAGAGNLDDLFGTYVVSIEDAPLLDERRATLQKYDQLIADADSWAPPLLVRRELSAWEFADAEQSIATAAMVISWRDQIMQRAAELSIRVEYDGETRFETAISEQDLAEISSALQELDRGLRELEEDRDAIRAQAQAMKTRVAFDEMSLSEAQADALAQNSAVATVSFVRGQVDSRADDLGLIAPPWPTSSDATDFAAATALGRARLATLDELEAATNAAEADRSAMERIGLWRSGVDQKLEDARAAFEADELDDVITATSTMEMFLTNASSTGQRRVIYAAIAIAAICTAIVVRRRLST